MASKGSLLGCTFVLVAALNAEAFVSSHISLRGVSHPGLIGVTSQRPRIATGLRVSALRAVCESD